jgi:hypothetical protein
VQVGEHGCGHGKADECEREQQHGRSDEVTHHQLAPLDGEAVGAIGLVDFLRQRFEHLEAEHEAEQRADHHERCGAAQDGHLARTDGSGERHHAHQSAHRQAQQAVPAAATHRVAAATTGQAQPRASAGVFVRQLAAQQDDCT